MIATNCFPGILRCCLVFALSAALAGCAAQRPFISSTEIPAVADEEKPLPPEIKPLTVEQEEAVENGT